MKGLALSLRRLACCTSPEPIPEPADRVEVAAPSSAMTRPPSQSPAWSQSPNETLSAHTQYAHPPATRFAHSPTMDDANENAPPACSSPDTSSASERTVPGPEQEKSPKRMADAVLCSLERLPVEVQTRILVESSLDSLQPLLKSSPRFYYVYSQNRLPILSKVLSCALDGFFLDAYAACMSDRYFAAEARAVTWKHLSQEYLDNPDAVPPTLAMDGLSLEVIQRMAHLHLRIVEPLTEHYCRWALGALSSSPQAAPLTKTEKSRIQRAMYRLQVICNFGIRDPQEMLAVLDSFGPWATEQIICVHEFVEERFMSALIECAREVQVNGDESPRDSHVDLLGMKAMLLVSQHEDLNVGALYDLLSLGLPVLQKTFQAEDLEELCDTIRGNIGIYCGMGRNFAWIDEAVQHHRQFERQWLSDHDVQEHTQQEMIFDQDDLLSPPLAWVTFWNGRYSNHFGGYIPNALHRWGYVMWDSKRLKESGAMEYIELEWQCKYGVRGSPEDDDPRDYYITAYHNQQQQVGNDD